MPNGGKPIVILLADDDEEDRMLAADALAESRDLVVGLRAGSAAGSDLLVIIHVLFVSLRPDRM